MMGLGRRQEISPQRLMEAAEACLQACAAPQPGMQPWPPYLVVSPLCPECLARFSLFEVTEATAFLVRMGFMERQKR